MRAFGYLSRTVRINSAYASMSFMHAEICRSIWNRVFKEKQFRTERGRAHVYVDLMTKGFSLSEFQSLGTFWIDKCLHVTAVPLEDNNTVASAEKRRTTGHA